MPDDCRKTGCPEGRLCDNGTCRPDLCFGVDCGPGFQCVDGQCLFVGECNIDPDCPKSYVCDAGRCVFVGECRSPLDCAPRETCVGGRCQPCPRGDCRRCADGRRCPPGFVCDELGECIPRVCRGDEDCAERRSATLRAS